MSHRWWWPLYAAPSNGTGQLQSPGCGAALGPLHPRAGGAAGDAAGWGQERKEAGRAVSVHGAGAATNRKSNRDTVGGSEHQRASQAGCAAPQGQTLRYLSCTLSKTPPSRSLTRRQGAMAPMWLPSTLIWEQSGISLPLGGCGVGWGMRRGGNDRGLVVAPRGGGEGGHRVPREHAQTHRAAPSRLSTTGCRWARRASSADAHGGAPGSGGSSAVPTRGGFGGERGRGLPGRAELRRCGRYACGRQAGWGRRRERKRQRQQLL